MKKVTVLFGTYNTIPAGSHDYQFEEAYQKSFKPFLSTLYGFPKFHCGLHYSGTLLQWLENNHSEFIDVLQELVRRKQVEIIGGPFYDPVLPLIPKTDRLGQIEALTTFVRKRFKRRPRGCWLPELVWEPSLVSSLKNSGIDYTFLEDHQFEAAGFTSQGLKTPCLTEDQGRTLAVFPIVTDFSESMLEKSPFELVSLLEEVAEEEEDPLVVIMKNGLDYCFKGINGQKCPVEEWLERVFILFSENSDWIETTFPARYVKNNVIKGRGYFPGTSVGNSDSNGLVFFRQNINRYYEANLLYSKMHYTHILVNQIRGDKYRKIAAREELWKAQTHSPYWHQFTGGIYDNHLRKHVYTSLIEAEKITREKGIFIPSIIKLDYDMDGFEEHLYQGHEINAYIHSQGGTLFELDFLASSWNYADSMGQYKESYHTKDVVKLGYDEYPRRCFVDHFLNETETLERFVQRNHREKGSFVSAFYETRKINRDNHEIDMICHGTVVSGKAEHSFTLEKRYVFRRTSINVYYRFLNTSEEVIRGLFAPEMNLSFASVFQESLSMYLIDRGAQKKLDPAMPLEFEAAEVLLKDQLNDTLVSLSFGQKASCWTYPLETASIQQGQDGFERQYQASCIVPRWKLDLQPGQEEEVRISILIEKM